MPYPYQHVYKTPSLLKRNAEIVQFASEHPGLTCQEVADHFQLSYCLTASILRAAGVKPFSPKKTGPRTPFTVERQKIMHELYTTSGDTTLAEIGELFGVTRERVRQLVSRQSEDKYRKAGKRTDPVQIAKIARTSDNMKVCYKQARTNPKNVEECLRALELWEPVNRLWRIRTKRKKRLKLEKRQEFLIKEMKRVALEIKHTPGTKDMHGNGRPWFTQYYRDFGSMRSAQIAAGLEPNSVGRPAKDLME